MNHKDLKAKPEDLKRLLMQSAMERLEEAMQSFPYKIYNDDEVLIADNLESALEILDGEISEQDLEQIEDMAMSGDVVPLLDTLDGFGYKVELEEKKSLASLRNRSSFDAQNRLKDKNKLPTPKIVKPAQMDLFDNEAGDHDRMYKVVHVKKGMMDIKAKTSYEAAKKFAQEKGLKSTAGVDVHLYPLEEGAMSDLHARIMSSDDPHDEIYKMLTQDGPEAEYIQAMYNETSIDRGLHPDDDFEDIIDAMVAELDDDNNPFENMNFMVAPPNKNPNFKSNMPSVPPRKKNDHNWRLRTINPAIMPGMPGFGDDSKRDKRPITTNLFNDTKVGEGKNKMGPQGIKPGDRVEHEGEKFEVVDVTPDPDAPGTIIADNLETGLRNRLKIDDVTRLFGADALTAQDEEELEAMFKRLKKVGSGSLKHVATEGYYKMPDIDKERYTPMQGLEGPFQTRSGKPVYYDPKEGSYYDRDTDMYLTYAEFKALDDPKPETGRMKESFTLQPLPQTQRVPMSNTQNFRKNFAKRYQSLYPSGNLSTTREGHSPHKKGTKKYKKHMAAMHANSVDLNTMRDALKLDESADVNTVVAEYTRATLDRSYKTWKQVDEQIAFIKSFVKEDVDVNAVATMIRKMHERENLDHNILVKENIDKLRDIIRDKSAMSIKFADGSMKVDMTTANIFVQMYDRMKERNQKKIDDMMQTKAGFLKVLDFFYGAMK